MLRFLPLVMIAASLAPAQFSIRPGAPGGALRLRSVELLNERGETVRLQGTTAPVDLPMAYAGTMFSTIRQRWNMNMVRLPLSVARAERDPGYLPHIREVVRRAHQAELYVILVAVEEGASLPSARTAAFWREWAAAFRDQPCVLFDLFAEPGAAAIAGHRPGIRREVEWQAWHDRMQPLVDTIRQAGARQPIAAMIFDDALLFDGFADRFRLTGGDILYEFCPRNGEHGTDALRDQAFGFLAGKLPLLATGWDPELERDAAECRALPRDPLAATRFVRSHLEYFDAHGIHWAASSFTPGRMIHSLDVMEPTELTREVTCGGDPGAAYPFQGIGIDVQLHQWSMTKDNIVTVSAGAGAIEVAQGGIAIGYAEVISTSEYPPGGAATALTLGGASLRVTDAAGQVRMAPLLYAGPGSINFIIDAETAPGMAQVELLRDDGRPVLEACILVSAVAPGFFTATMNARGPAIAFDEAGRPLWACAASACRTLPVQVPGQVRLPGSGFRNADPATLQATFGGKPVRIVQARPQPDVTYNDELTIELDASLAGLGEEDLVFWAGGRVANVVRLRVQ